MNPTRRRVLTFVGVAVALIAPVTTNALAADPGSGIVGPGTPSQTWDGEVYASAVTPDPFACPEAANDPDNAICDHYALYVDVDPSYWVDRNGTVDVSITWADGTDNFDLYVYDADGMLVGSSAQGGTASETAVLSEPSGAYEVRVVPALVTDSGYAGEVQFPYQPNIVYIMADDFSSNIVPHMREVQAMTSEGITFNNYIVSNSQCCPSRAGFMTGKYPHNNHVEKNAWPNGGFGAFYENDQSESIGVYLDRAGYRTGFMGKFLNQYHPDGNPPGSPNGEPGFPAAYVPPGWDEAWLVDIGRTHFKYKVTDSRDGVASVTSVDDLDPANYLTDRLADRAVEFIADTADDPFFLTVTPFAVHAGGNGDPERYQFPPAPRDRPDSARRPVEWPEPPFRKGDCGDVGCRKLSYPTTPDHNMIITDGPWWAPTVPLTEDQIRPAERLFMDRVRMAQAMDDLIGEVRAALELSGVADETWIVFGSDNGFHLGEHALQKGKNTPYDHDLRLPFIVVPPGGTAPRVEQALVSNVDLMPTFSQMAGITVFDEPIDGQSFQHLLDGTGTEPLRNAALVQFVRDRARDDPDRAVGRDIRVPTFKAMRTVNYLYADYGVLDANPPVDHLTGEYYDLATDPHQLTNLYDSLTADRRLALNGALQAYAACEGATCVLAGQAAP